MHVIPGRGCVCGVVGPNLIGATSLVGSEKASWLTEVVWDGLP